MKEVAVFVAMGLMTLTTACGAGAGPTQAVAGTPDNVAVSQQYQYYDVSGATPDQIRAEMNQNGTKWDDGRTYDSVTTWNLKWTYDYDCSNHTCRAGGFKTNVDITFRFPKWIQPADASQDLIAKWDTYMQHLITHENGHRDMAVAAAEQLCRDVQTLPLAESPEALDKEIQALASNEMDRLNTDEKQYDVTTIHGTTQGAVFP